MSLNRIDIEEYIDEIIEYMSKHHSYPNVMYMDKMIKRFKKNNERLAEVANYYKIGKHGKIEELTNFDRENINKFPENTIFYEKFPEEAIKLDI